LSKTVSRIKSVDITIVENAKERVEKITVVKAGLGNWKGLTDTLKTLLGILPEVLEKRGIEDIEKYTENMTYQDLLLLIPDMFDVATDEVINLLAVGTGKDFEYINKYVGIDEAIELFEAIAEVNNLMKVVETGKNWIPLLNTINKIRRK